MYHNFLIHSFADGHLGCFQYLAIVNCAAMNIGVHRFFWIGKFLNNVFPDHRSTIVLLFLLSLSSGTFSLLSLHSQNFLVVPVHYLSGIICFLTLGRPQLACQVSFFLSLVLTIGLRPNWSAVGENSGANV